MKKNQIKEYLNIDDLERRQPTDIKQETPIVSSATTQPAFGAESSSQLLAQAEYVVKKLGHLHIDVTAHYPDWLAVGFAFAESFAEMGRPLFHSISELYANYSADETDRQYDRCLRNNYAGPKINIGTFFHLAKQAGIDMAEAYHATHQFPPKSIKPQNGDSGKDIEYMGKSIDSMGKNIDSMGKTTAPAADNVCQIDIDEQAILPTITDKLYADRLPPVIMDVIKVARNPAQADLFLLSFLTIVSAFLYGFRSFYMSGLVWANLMTFIYAIASAGKGGMSQVVEFLKPILDEYQADYDRRFAEYKQKLQDYRRAKRNPNADPIDEPEKPIFSVPLIPGNSSASAMLQMLAENEGRGIVVETEADTLSVALAQDYGNFSDAIRKAAHHEHLSMRRRKDNEFISIDKPQLSLLLTGTESQISKLIHTKEDGTASRLIYYRLRTQLEWIDPFDSSRGSLDDFFLKLGEQFMPLYHVMVQRKNQPILMTLSPEARKKHHDFFAPLQREEVAQNGYGVLPTVRRMGLVVLRISMALTALRYLADPDQLADAVEIPIDDRDIDTALVIAEQLMVHANHVLANLIDDHKPVQTQVDLIQMPLAHKTLFNALPEEFTDAARKEVSKQLGLSVKTTEKWLGPWRNKYHVIEKTKQGHYRKLISQV